MKVVVLADAPAALIELCGVSLLERLLRTLQRAAVREVVILSSTPETLEKELAKPSPPRSEIAFTICGWKTGPLRNEEISAAVGGSDLLLILPGDTVWDDRLVRLLVSRHEPAVLIDSAPPQPFAARMPRTTQGWLTGAAVLHHDWISAGGGSFYEVMCRGVDEGRLTPLDIAAQPSYSLALRRELRPLWIPAPDRAQRKQAERLILDAAQKGSLDLPAWVHGPIETFLVSHLCRTSITPKQLTALCNVAAWAAAILFATGQLAWGTALALAVGVLDGLDGKQARVKVETSEAGKLEHWLDTFYELAWAFALAYHFHASGQLPGAYYYLLLLLASEGVDGLAKVSIIRRYGRLIDELGPLDRIIRFVAGRRNIYIWILAAGLLLGAPAKAFVVMACWEAISAGVHVFRAVWALWIRPLDFSGRPA